MWKYAITALTLANGFTLLAANCSSIQVQQYRFCPSDWYITINLFSLPSRQSALLGATFYSIGDEGIWSDCSVNPSKTIVEIPVAPPDPAVMLVMVTMVGHTKESSSPSESIDQSSFPKPNQEVLLPELYRTATLSLHWTGVHKTLNVANRCSRGPNQASVLWQVKGQNVLLLNRLWHH